MQQVLSTELEILEKGLRKKDFFRPPVQARSSICWTGKIVDLVELLYALDTCNCINNGEIGVEELAEALSKIFGVEIKNCFSAYIDMKRRKADSRTYFLDELREKLNRRMVESDLKGGNYKKR